MKENNSWTSVAERMPKKGCLPKAPVSYRSEKVPVKEIEQDFMNASPPQVMRRTVTEADNGS